MKLQHESKELDLYVSDKKMTERERKELADFIEQVRQKQKGKKQGKAV